MSRVDRVKKAMRRVDSMNPDMGGALWQIALLLAEFLDEREK